MNRQKIIVIVSGAVVAVLCIAAAVFVYISFSAANEAENQRNQTYNDLQAIYQSKQFPSPANIEQIKREQGELGEWLGALSNVLHAGDSPIEENLSNVRFKQIMQDTVRTLVREGKSCVAPEFKFGFDAYLGDSSTLPEPSNVKRLNQQLGVIRALVGELYAAKILKLEQVGRELFDTIKKDEGQQADEQTGGRRRGRRGQEAQASEDADKAKATEVHVSASGLYSSETFTLEFQATPAEFTEVLNRLALLDRFVAVTDVEARKTEDLFARLASETKKQQEQGGGDAAAALPEDLSKVPHLKRIVCDPSRDAPLRVKLTVEVYSFSGV